METVVLLPDVVRDSVNQFFLGTKPDQDIAICTTAKRLQVLLPETQLTNHLANLIQRFIMVDEDCLSRRQVIINLFRTGQNNTRPGLDIAGQLPRIRLMGIVAGVKTSQAQPLAQPAQGAFRHETILAVWCYLCSHGFTFHWKAARDVLLGWQGVQPKNRPVNLSVKSAPG